MIIWVVDVSFFFLVKWKFLQIIAQKISPTQMVPQGFFAFVKNKFTFTSRTVTKNSCKKFFRVFCLFLILKITIFACFQFIFFFHHFINNNFSFIFAYRKKEKYFYVILCYVDVGAFQIYLEGEVARVTSRWYQRFVGFQVFTKHFSQCFPIVITVGKRITFDSRKSFWFMTKGSARVDITDEMARLNDIFNKT